MYIEVMNDKNEIFRGDADEFLELNDYDIELESSLSNLNERIVGATTRFINENGVEFFIRRIRNEELLY